MKYVVMVDYEIQDVFDIMGDAFDEMTWQKELGYQAHIKTMPEDTKAYRTALVAQQKALSEAEIRATHEQHLSEQKRIADVRAEFKRLARRVKIGLMTLMGLLLLGWYFW